MAEPSHRPPPPEVRAYDEMAFLFSGPLAELDVVVPELALPGARFLRRAGRQPPGTGHPQEAGGALRPDEGGEDLLRGDSHLLTLACSTILIS